MSDAAQGEGDIVERPAPAAAGVDHDRIEALVPMRDGERLHTLVILPKDAAETPLVLDRTPYGPGDIFAGPPGARAAEFLHPLHADLFAAGYGLVVQNVRGKFGSEGVYEMNRSVRGPFNATDTDHVTDAWDTVAWLVDNVPGTSGRVAALGLSYDGFTALMHLLDPHPALAACVAINAMVDGWTGDDWFRNGAFRQLPALHYVNRQTTARSAGAAWPSPAHDEYAAWLDAGSAHGMAERLGLAHLPAWERFEAHPAYDAYWRGQALDRLLAGRDVRTPTLHVHSQFDVEDPYGATATFAALRSGASNPGLHHLVTGPWSHVCPFFTDGERLGPLAFGVRTARAFRQEVLIPFLDAHLRPGAGEALPAPVTAFTSGADGWMDFADWPPPDAKPLRLHLAPGFRLLDAPPDNAAGCDAYVSDPHKPVTHQPRPILRKDAPGFAWERLAVIDQRFAGDRPDVLRYASEPLEALLQLAGEPVFTLFASTTGADADWFVKLIDAYPDVTPGEPDMGGYELAISTGVLRARYRDDPGMPTPVPAGEVVAYTLRMPHVCRTVMPGHRLMVQVQSTMFPLYDRNPQTFVPNIFFARPEDFEAATHTVFRRPGAASAITLPTIPPRPVRCSPRASR